MALLATVVRALKWSMFAEIASRFVGPLVFIILARLLVPEDFGVVAAATVTISFSQVFFDSGLSRAIIQRQGDDKVSADAALGINLWISVILAAALYVAAPSIAIFFGDSRIAPVLRVLSLQLPMAAICSVFTALMYKRFEFKQLFWVRLATNTAPGLVSIPLAVSGLSYWALVAGVLAGQFLQLLVLVSIASWRPSLTVDLKVARELLAFGRWSLASGVLAWSYGWLDALVVGHFLGPRDMGLYRTGNTFAITVFGLIFAPLLPVLYSAFSRAQHDLARLREALSIVARVIALVSLPIGVALLYLRDDLGQLVLGSQWEGVGSVIGMMGVSHALGWIAGVNGELYRAIGKPHVETYSLFAMLALYVPTYFYAVGYGLEVFLQARVVLAVAALVLHTVVCWYIVGINPISWIRSCVWAVLAALLAGTITASLYADATSLLARVAFSVVVAGGIYALAIALIEWSFLRRLYAMFRLGQGRTSDHTRNFMDGS